MSIRIGTKLMRMYLEQTTTTKLVKNNLIWLIEDLKLSFILRLGCKFEILNILG